MNSTAELKYKKYLSGLLIILSGFLSISAKSTIIPQETSLEQSFNVTYDDASIIINPYTTTSNAIPQILIAEDNFFHSKILKNRLRKKLAQKKYMLVFVENGEKALKKLKEKKFVLLITDICMPVVTGISLIKQIQDNTSKDHIQASNLNIPIAVYSSEYREGPEGIENKIPKNVKIFRKNSLVDLEGLMHFVDEHLK